ncbi:DNA ligase [Pseudorhodoferax sp. Leaf267]|uniref:DNA ligase n=1 Tax=Pseudorhodoferax sp. Leaf267 TaxID=1736316 RepID=UPI0006F688C0|nr:DNA ligase [Pseudorhodoferax sp. Leaf267]KQP19987.1 ATP-dependent DNA ligase [Pseudorhodoferax sp. Leaf267]
MWTAASAKWSAGSTNRLRRALVLAALAATLPAAAAPPRLMLANVYRRGMPLAGYWVREKYDGLRAYWDGRQLWTRGGERIVPPAWFTAPLPGVALDGELWAGRGRFEQALATVRSQQPSDAAWRAMRYMVFDLPAEPGDFDRRLQRLNSLLPLSGVPWVVAVPQQRATTHQALQAELDRIVRAGGEGLMLHLGSAPYRSERNDDLLKFKPYDDAEARVVGYVPGQGRHAGRLGALIVETGEGLRFRLGSGFTDAQRADPPPIGALVTYRYNGLHGSGMPRHARFLRVRLDG